MLDINKSNRLILNYLVYNAIIGLLTEHETDASGRTDFCASNDFDELFATIAKVPGGNVW